MEFGLGAALPLYAGGLGVLAGDFLKTASDLDVPVIGVGLLYQEGYFRQVIDSNGMQEEFYPYNEPATLPIRPVVMADGSPLRICLELPGRLLRLRAWHAAVGRRILYLLDSNDPLNTAPDRGITAKLYGGGPETRLLQEIVASPDFAREAPDAQDRIRATMELMQKLGSWADEMLRLSPGTLDKVLSLGASVQRFVRGGPAAPAGDKGDDAHHARLPMI